MWSIEERVRRCGEYIAATGCTVRACAAALGTSKSTVHKDMTERLVHYDPALFETVKGILENNLRERHIRGGESTRKKYAARKGRAR